MSSDFFFSILRVTTAQIFRSAGVDRCSPSLLDTITDLFIRHLDLLSRTASRNASLAGRIEVTLQDVSLAMENVGLVKPFSLLEEDDFDSLTVDGFDLFIQWATGPVPEEARRVAGLANAGKATGADNEGTSNDTEWLTSLVKKHAKIDHELKLKGTLLADPNFDGELVHKIAGGPSTIFDDEHVESSYLDLLESQAVRIESQDEKSGELVDDKQNDNQNTAIHSEQHLDQEDSSNDQADAQSEDGDSSNIESKPAESEKPSEKLLESADLKEVEQPAEDAASIQSPKPSETETNNNTEGKSLEGNDATSPADLKDDAEDAEMNDVNDNAE